MNKKTGLTNNVYKTSSHIADTANSVEAGIPGSKELLSTTDGAVLETVHDTGINPGKNRISNMAHIRAFFKHGSITD
jgi:hypothetical protein